MLFAEKLLVLRKQKNMSQDDLAEVLEVSRQSISKWESGQSMPDTLKLIKISEVFDVTIDQLLKNELSIESQQPLEIEESETNTEEPSDPVSQPSKASLDYQIMTVNGTSKDRGYYVVEVEEDGYPYDVIISSGERSTGGYDIQIMSVDYDGSLLTITVDETAPGPTDMVTEALTYPSCAIELSILPDEIKVVTTAGEELKCLDTKLGDSAIEDGWLCVIEEGTGEVMLKTFVYENADGTYKYINVKSTTTSWGATTWNDVVKGSGTADTRDDVAAAAEEFGSCGFVLLPNDYQTVYTVEEFTAGKAF